MATTKSSVSSTCGPGNDGNAPKETNNNVEIPIGEQIFIPIKEEEEEEIEYENQVDRGPAPISLKIENPVEPDPLMVGKLKVRSFASLNNSPIPTLPPSFQEIRRPPHPFPAKIQNAHSANFLPFNPLNPFSMPNPMSPFPIPHQFLYSGPIAGNHRPYMYNPFLPQGLFLSHQVPNPPRIQRLRAAHYVPLKIPSVTLPRFSSQSTTSSSSQPSPLHPVSCSSASQISDQSSAPLNLASVCIKIPEYKAPVHSSEDVCLKPTKDVQCKKEEEEDVKPKVLPVDFDVQPDSFVKEELNIELHNEEELASDKDAEGAETHFMSESQETQGSNDPQSTVGEDQKSIKAEENSDSDVEGECIKRVNFQHTSGKHSCQGCNYACNSFNVMRKHHEKYHSPKSNYRCLLCENVELTHQSFDHLVHHVATLHKGQKRWQCKKCGKSYKSRMNYKNHMSTKCKVIDPYACHQCTFTCQTFEALEKHRKKHTKAKEVETCPLCSRVVKKISIKVHMSTCHYPVEKTFNCEQCEYKGLRFANLKQHYKKTLHNRVYSCPDCLARFITEEGYLNHEDRCPASRRALEQYYFCKFEGCKKKFLVERLYLLHTKLHTLPDEELYLCVNEDCNFKSIYRSSMENHYTKTKHNRPHQCPNCSLRFSKESSLSYHIDRVHVAQILKMSNMSQRSPSPVRKPESDGEEVAGEEAAIANFKSGWLGIPWYDTDEMHSPPTGPTDISATGECSTATIDAASADINEDAETFQYAIPEVNCILEYPEQQSDVEVSLCDSEIKQEAEEEGVEDTDDFPDVLLPEVQMDVAS